NVSFLQHVEAVSNPFAYTDNNPVNFIDPTGKWVTVVAIGVPVLAGGAMTWLIVRTIKKCAEKFPCNDPLQPSKRAENIERCVVTTLHLTKFLGWETGGGAISNLVNTAVQESLEEDQCCEK
ncbi:hypothetical protein KA005_17585, partial [bacterium]|nr:hypothetical protein [bacterium]